MFALGYWFLSNRQIFFNEPYANIEHANGSQNTLHDLYYFNNNYNQSHMAVAVCVIIVFQMTFANPLHFLFSLCFSSKLKHKDVDENLDSYWNSIIGKE